VIIKLCKSPYITDQFRFLFPTITLICGIMIVVGVFLPWFHVSMSVWILTLPYSSSGWEMATHNSFFMQVLTYFSNLTFPQAYYMLSAGALLIACTLCAFTITLVKKEWLNVTAKVQGIAAVMAALYSVGIAVWFLARGNDMNSYLNDSIINVDSSGLGYGFYISTAFSVLALIAGTIMTKRVFCQTKHYNKEGLLK
jgi:hypothetical protein